jgi:predicted O-methyltransferase YrrM
MRQIFGLPKEILLKVLLLVVAGTLAGMIWLRVGLDPALLIIVLVLTGFWFVLWRVKMSLHKTQQDILANLRNQQKRIEAFVALNAALKPTYPIPELEIWSITPQFANILMNHIGLHKPLVILECGSGVSTLIMAYCIARSGRGHVFSLEHLEEYVRSSNDLLRLHGLEAHATVFHAPLIETTLGSNTWKWYDPSAIRDLSSIDMLVVDGPPGTGSTMARYPVVPLLEEKLNPHTVILLDDYDRPDERAIAKLWATQHGFSQITEYKVERGVCILRRPAVF